MASSHSLSKPQLKMNWPVARLADPPVVELPPGYQLQLLQPAREPEFVDLMRECGWSEWDDELLDYCKSRMLPRGWFAVIDSQSDRLVASAMSLHNYTDKLPGSGTLGWVGCRTQHRGQGLGAVVVASVTGRLIDAGYHDIELYTEHFRTAALRSYLRLGYLPYIYSAEVSAVWQEVCSELSWPFSPQHWPCGNDAFPSPSSD